MLASTVPWAPVVAFMVSSPISSPTSLLLAAGLFGWPFAATFFAASIVLGLVGGAVAAALEQAGLLANQARFRELAPEPAPSVAEAPAGARSCCSARPTFEPSASPVLRPAPAVAAAIVSGSPCCGGKGSAPGPGLVERWRLPEVGKAALVAGRSLVLVFLVFATIGYLLANLIPNDWVLALFGGDQAHGVLLAATMGIPLYINTESSLPLARGFMDAGMSPGAVLAFLITGAGTSIGAVGGLLIIARWRVIGLVVATLLVGAVILGQAYSLVSP